MRIIQEKNIENGLKIAKLEISVNIFSLLIYAEERILTTICKIILKYFKLSKNTVKTIKNIIPNSI